jgi:hypothetical protein
LKAHQLSTLAALGWVLGRGTVRSE